MKRPIITLLMAVIFTATLLTSCKKEETQELAKEKTERLLTSKKWYYNSVTRDLNSEEPYSECYDSEEYNIKYNKDGSSIEVWDGDTYDGLYSISEDGKTYKINENIYTITLLDDTKLVIKNDYSEFFLSSSPKDCPK